MAVSFASAPMAGPRRVVSLRVSPGTLAPTAPVPVESPDVVEGFPLQAERANNITVTAKIDKRFIGCNFVVVQNLKMNCFEKM